MLFCSHALLLFTSKPSSVSARLCDGFCPSPYQSTTSCCFISSTPRSYAQHQTPPGSPHTAACRPWGLSTSPTQRPSQSWSKSWPSWALWPLRTTRAPCWRCCKASHPKCWLTVSLPTWHTCLLPAVLLGLGAALGGLQASCRYTDALHHPYIVLTVLLCLLLCCCRFAGGGGGGVTSAEKYHTISTAVTVPVTVPVTVTVTVTDMLFAPCCHIACF